MSPSKPRRVAVIGAGMAGLSCAAELKQAGLEVCVFEKSRGPGGRLCTRRVDGSRFDHGAPGFEVSSSTFAQRVGAWVEAGVVQRSQVERARWREGRFETIESRPSWLGVPRMSALGRFLARGLDLRLETRVAELTRCAEGWRLRGGDGSHLGVFDFVILACPAPQAAQLLPLDSPLRAAAKSVRFESAWVLMWKAREELRLKVEHIEFDDPVLEQAFAEQARPGRAAGFGWVVHARSEWSRERLGDAPEAVAELLARRFEALMGLAPASNTWAHRWRYAGVQRPATGCTFDASRGLALAGDATHGRGVEAAWNSGREVAVQILGLGEALVAADSGT